MAEARLAEVPHEQLYMVGPLAQIRADIHHIIIRITGIRPTLQTALKHHLPAIDIQPVFAIHTHISQHCTRHCIQLDIPAKTHP